ncbi:hypothetical protein Thermus77420_20470 [Thermus thalpophilus]
MGYRKYFLVGSDYVFPRTANLILKKHIAQKGGEVVGEEYVPLGGTDFSSVVTKIRASGAQIIFNTINGDSNVAFFKQMAAAGLPPKKLPVMSFSIAEQEAKAIGPSLLQKSLAAWNYFMSLDTPQNRAFVQAYRSRYGKDAVITDPMVHGYVGVYLWKAAVERAKSFEVDAVRKAAVAMGWTETPLGRVRFDVNQSLYQTAYVGELQGDGQFKILWASKEPIRPEPFDPLAFPGKTCKLH